MVDQKNRTLVLALVIKASVMLLVMVMAAPTFAQVDGEENWWDHDPWSNPDRGFNWYPPDQPIKPKTKPKNQEKQSPPPQEKEKPKSIKDMPRLEDLKRELERLKEEAIMRPTEANVYAYLDAQQFVMQKSSDFVSAWTRVRYQNPDVDYNTRSPAANFALTQMRENRTAETNSMLARISKTHGVLFFFRSDCKFCHMQAPIMRMLRENYGIDVLAISVDGGVLPQFPDAKKDNGISMAVSRGRGIETVPALYLVSNDQKQVIPLGAGVMALDEIVERIRVLYSTKPSAGG